MIAKDSKPGKVEYPEKNYIGNTTTVDTPALGTTGSAILDRKVVPEPIENVKNKNLLIDGFVKIVLIILLILESFARRKFRYC